MRAASENWRRWGPYLSERQWGTVREDYSPHGNAWEAFPHDHARSRAYRWGEDGLLGICDRECRVALALALWNGHDPILKERLFGLTGPEGNHGEDVKELYYYLDATPTASYLKALYKYPQAAYPYSWLVDENRRRTKADPEFELVDTGVFDDGRYFDVTAEYAKAAPDDVSLRVTVTNRGPDAARIHVLPTLWCRNTWSWGGGYEADWGKPEITADGDWGFLVDHPSLGRYRVDVDEGPSGRPKLLFTDNETNAERLFGFASASPFTKDAFDQLPRCGALRCRRPRAARERRPPLTTCSSSPAASRRPSGFAFARTKAAPTRPSGTSSTGSSPPASPRPTPSTRPGAGAAIDPEARARDRGRPTPA